mmetsp:Transcript_13626/g.20036  ORF Transcript_13626/g.20036 Transcript_13626/m.20036 type:complete len:102 (-) Transcript_13626:345-650(-)
MLTIDMYIKKGMIVAKCKACGWAGDLDNNHRLAAIASAFLLRDEPRHLVTVLWVIMCRRDVDHRHGWLARCLSSPLRSLPAAVWMELCMKRPWRHVRTVEG